MKAIKDKKPHQLKLASMLQGWKPSIRKSGKHLSQEKAAMKRRSRKRKKKEQ